MASAIRNAVPWWMRIGVKIALARLPIPYGFWKKLHLFEHGDMNQPQRSLDNFLEHAEMAGVLEPKAGFPQLKVGDDEFVVLEIGPGDSLFSALIARALGASSTWLVDAGAYAATDTLAYDNLAKLLREKGADIPFDLNSVRLPEILKLCGGKYLTQGVESLAEIPAASVNYCFSNAVLEHIPKADFPKMIDEMARVMKPTGVMVHRVDLKDHLGGGLNNLRFSESRWEGALFRNSGFYTNRIRFNEMMTSFKNSGFSCDLPRIARWAKLPLSRRKMDESFQELPDEDLLVSGFDVVMRCAA
jgi:SAM-dependent methyltransferase